MHKLFIYHVTITGLLWVATIVSASAQMMFLGDTMKLQMFTVEASREVVFDIGTMKIEADSAILRQADGEELKDLLQCLAPLNVNNMGTSGALSTLSMRGAGGSRTLLTWNGVPLNSITSGDVNLSLLNGNIFNSVAIDYSAPSTIYGSNSFGGVISLNNKRYFNKGFKTVLSQTIGSYNTYKSYGSVGYSNKKLAINAQLWNNSSDNNFAYFDKYYRIELNRKNAEHLNKGILSDVSYKHKNHLLNAGIWIQNNNAEIPELNGSKPDQKQQLQDDASLRAYAAWQYQFKKLFWLLNAYQSFDKLHYLSKNTAEQSFWDIDSEILTYQAGMNGEFRYKLSPNITSDVGVNLRHNRVGGTNYSNQPDEVQLAFFSATKLSFDPIQMVVTARKELHTHYDPPFIFGAGAEYEPLSGLVFRAATNQKFRTPTFNDKYWPLSGVLDIKPELGVTYEAGLTWETEINSLKVKADGTVYRNQMNRIIVWQPAEGALWKPTNLEDLSATGIESRLDVFVPIVKKISFRGLASFDVNRTYQNNDKNKLQLRYTPKYRVNLGSIIEVYDFKVMASYTFLSRRRYDESVYTLPEYSHLSFKTYYTFNAGATNWSLWFKIDNALDSKEPYRKDYVVPGRHYNLGLKFEI